MSSTILTLLVLPALYNLVEGAKERRAARRGDVVPAVAGASAGSQAPLTRRARRDAASVAVTGAAAVDTALVIEEAPDIEIPVDEPAAVEEPVVEEPGADEPRREE